MHLDSEDCQTKSENTRKGILKSREERINVKKNVLKSEKVTFWPRYFVSNPF